VTLLALLRFHLRRHRTAFVAAVSVGFLHQIAFLALFRFWKSNSELATTAIRLLPKPIREGFGFPVEDLSDPRVYEALYFMRPELRALLVLFGVAVSTAALAGEVGGGTGDLLFSHPVRRRTAILSGALAAAIQLAAFGVAILLGFVVGTALLPMGDGQPTIAQLAPVVGMAVFGTLAIVATTFPFSAACASRAQAVGWSLALVIVPMFLDFVVLFWKPIERVAPCFPEHWYRPHRILAAPAVQSIPTIAGCLAAFCVVSFGVSAWIAERRDLSR